MNIGFSNIYSFRPHVEHLYYLSLLARQAGHATFFLTCDSGVSNCYARELKGTSRLQECPKCVLGGVRSFPVSPVTSISSLPSGLSADQLKLIALSSSCTLTRTELDTDWQKADTVHIRDSLLEPISRTYASARQWIERNRLEAVVCFNGRMDLTRAVTLACEHAGIPFVTHERTWFGDGLHMVPNANCLSIAPVNALSRAYGDKPLTTSQAMLAAKLAAERFLQRNSLEWRVYNRNPEPTPWPVPSSGRKVLVLPSSRNEYAGHPEWKSGWGDNTQALDDFFEAYAIQAHEVVVRCHPNWSETIGRVSGLRSLEVYRDWALQRGIHFISSEQKASTYDLIQQCDIVVLNGGSSAVEAGVCGKSVVCLGPVNYEDAGFVQVFRDPAALQSGRSLDVPDPDEVIRRTLRFIYLSARRFPQYADHVRAIQTTRYAYFEGGDPQRLLSMLETGLVAADDPDVAADLTQETPWVDLLKARQWGTLVEHEPVRPALVPMDVGRRHALRWIDTVRSRMRLGDRG